jgi:hypothetical protein
MAYAAMDHLIRVMSNKKDDGIHTCIGLRRDEIVWTDIKKIMTTVNMQRRIPKEQWWHRLIPVFDALSQSGPWKEEESNVLSAKVSESIQAEQPSVSTVPREQSKSEGTTLSKVPFELFLYTIGLVSGLLVSSFLVKNRN